MGSFSLTKNADFDKYKYFGYGIGFDAWRCFHYLMVVSLVSSGRKGPTQWLDNTALNAEKGNIINFREQHKQFCLSLHYNGASSDLSVNGVEISKFKAKDSKMNAAPLWLCNVSNDFPVENIKLT